MFVSKTLGFKNLIYSPNFVKPADKLAIMNYLAGLYPIWEMRYSASNPPPEGQTQRRLLRPVYWLGNWQFACLDYYHPPKGLRYRCVEAEGFPPVLAHLIKQIEDLIHNSVHPKDIPQGWHLNTCLINYYGELIDEQGKRSDVARVGEHKDFEPGPVASISFGERALFQFVDSKHKQARSQVILQQWLEDSSLQVFAGEKFKKSLFHRVQRVEKKGSHFDFLNTPEFATRRVNFTFRYVPNEHIYPFSELPSDKQQDIKPYVQELAKNSTFFATVLSSI